MQKATVIYSGYSPSAVEEGVALTDEDTMRSAILVARALGRLGYQVAKEEIHPERLEKQVASLEADLFFNLCEWSGLDYGLGVRVIEILEDRGVVFTGASSDNFIWGSEKQLMKKLFDNQGIPTPRWFVYEGGVSVAGQGIPFPVIVKPAWEHCAIGISQDSVVWDSPTLEKKTLEMWRKFRQPILGEEFIDGTEYQVTVLEKYGEPWVLPPAEIIYQKEEGYRPILTFETKWVEDCPEDKFSVIREFSGSAAKEKRIKAMCATAFQKLDCHDFVRFDMREMGGEIFFLEANVNPGLDWDPYYSMTISAKAAKMNFGDLVRTIVESTRPRFKKAETRRLDIAYA